MVPAHHGCSEHFRLQVYPIEGDLKPLRDRLRARAEELGLRGTILISHEGINLFIAGSREVVEAMLATLRELPGLEVFPRQGKLERCPTFPAHAGEDQAGDHRLRSRNRSRPAQAPRLTPRELKQWLNKGRPVTLLDTRNDYEVKLGFRGAVVPPLTRFSAIFRRPWRPCR